MSNGHRIIEGIKDAMAGNFARVTIDGQTWVRADEPVSNETTRLKLLADLLREHQCRSDGAMTVSQCVDSGRCGCSVGLVLVSNETNGWCPIESAPKDRMLLVGFYNSLGKWRSIHAQYRDDLLQNEYDEDEDEYAPPGWYEGSLEAEMLFPVKPTHWMSLPLPPLPTREPEGR